MTNSNSNTMINNNFESKEFNSLMNINNVWGKYFNGMPMYVNKEILAVSSKLNGLEEFCRVLNYIKKGREVSILVEFCGDDGLWNEWVNVSDCKPYNILG